MPPEDPRVRFAAERTLLAWIRTGIALMGFGFVVAKFGLFLRQFRLMFANTAGTGETGWSTGFGISLVLAGALVMTLSAIQYRKVIQRIDRAEPFVPPTWSLGIIAAICLSVIGLAMGVYLLELSER